MDKQTIKIVLIAAVVAIVVDMLIMPMIDKARDRFEGLDDED